MISWDDYSLWLAPQAAEFNATSTKNRAPDPDQLATDSRTIKPGEWFVPLSGELFDGHRFIAAAMAQGASGFFYAAHRAGDLPSELLAHGIAVKDPLAAMQAIASGWRQTLPHLTLAALTGSTGKTTTKEMLSAIFQAAGHTLATHASFNNEIGVPKTLLQLKPEHRFAIAEFGARMPGNIRFLCEMAKPNIVGLINVGMSHVGIFGSIENLLHTKLEIFHNSPAAAHQVALHDDPRILEGARSTGKRTMTFGRHNDADVRIVETDWSKANGGMKIKFRANRQVFDVCLAAAHESYPINAAAAATMAMAAGIDAETIVRGFKNFSGIKGRYQIHSLDGFVLIDDTYNASPDSMRSGLATVAKSFGESRKTIILGDMLELGDCSPDEHKKIGAYAVQTLGDQLIDNLICIGEDARFIAEGAHTEGLSSHKILQFKSVDELIALIGSSRNLHEWRRHSDLVYAKASHGIHLDRLVTRLCEQSVQKP